MNNVTFYADSEFHALPDRIDSGGVVYILDMGDRLKIGVSKRVRLRIYTLVTHEQKYGGGRSAVGAWVSDRVDNPRKAEKDVLVAFEKFRVLGTELLVGVSAQEVASYLAQHESFIPEVVPVEICQRRLTPDRLTAVDLWDLPNEHMAALRREAIRQGISLSDLCSKLVMEKSRQLVASMSAPPKTTDIIRAATEANRGHHDLPEPEALN